MAYKNADLPRNNHGKILEGVERYPDGRIKYKRDSSKEHQMQKAREKKINSSIPIPLAQEFEAKLALEGSNKNAKIRGWIEGYVYSNDPK